MGPFALPKWQIVIASIFGVLLFFMNFFILLQGENIEWYLILILVIVSLIYVYMIIKAIIEPSSELLKMTKEEMDDHEYDQVKVPDEDK